MNRHITIRNAHANNLKNISLEIPTGKLVVVCGVSGSGKSSLLHDILGKEGQRLFHEHFLSGSQRQNFRLGRPEADSIKGLNAVIALSQQGNASSPRSTVGTITGLWDLLRLLFARFAQSKSVPEANRSLFSFNSPTGQCPQCKGLGVEDHIDPLLLIGDDSKTIREGALVLTTPNGYIIYSQVTMNELNKVCNAEGFSVDIPWRELSEEKKNIIYNGSEKIKILFGKHTLESRMKWVGITAKPREEGFYKGIVPVMEEILNRDRHPNILRFARSFTCNACNGTRLRPEALSFSFKNNNIDHFHRMAIGEIHHFFSNLEAENEAEKQIFGQIVKKTTVLLELGSGYLSLNRESATLSVGELNRLRLASYTTSGLRNILYLLDEPGAGLHFSELTSMMKVLRRLVENGNTVLVADHHEQNLALADFVIEIGPGAGNNGGHVLFSGSADAYFSSTVEGSQTQPFFIDKVEPVSAEPTSEAFVIQNAELHNLKNIDVPVFHNAFNMVVGVSGAGKTTLLKVLHNQAQSRKSFGKIVHIDSTPFGRSPRSNPATYTGLSDVLRDLFAAAPEAKKRRFTKTHFSLAVPGGRCEDCQGAGLKQIGMHFLGNVEIPCETCHGKRFSADVLEVRVADKNMFDVLDMTVADAHAFFEKEPKIRKYTQPLIDLGLGYVKLGQSSTTLSGGEAQRVKLASELVRSATASTLFILDEPATGLHPYDVGNLILAIRKLSAKHTVVIAGHDLRMIAQADFVVELGPGSGNDGGNVVFAGTPAALMAKADSLTGKALISQKNFKKPICKEVADLSGLPVVLKNVGTNNLQIDEVTFEANRLTAVCGPSGSGKSSLVFDTLYSASQNALLDGLSFRIRQNMSKAGNAVLDEFSGLMPAIALEKKSASKNPRSTVATYTGVYDLYRLLMSRFSKNNNEPCKLYSTAFSFNHEQGACPECHGLGYITQCDPQKLVSNPALSLEDGALDGSKPGKFYGETLGQYVATLRTVGKIHGFDFSGPFSQLCGEAVSLAMHGCGETLFDVEWHYKRGNLSGTHRMKIAWLGFCGLVEEEYSRKHFDHRAVQFSGIMTDMLCKVCEGNRVHRERLEYRFNGKHIGELTQMSATEAMEWFSSGNIPTGAESIVAEIAERLKSLIEAGIGYIGLNRISSTLSGGEFQRLRMASLLQSQLSGVMIVMDEPSFGLSKSDAKRISMLLKKVVLRGNTMAITDHHPEMLSNASAVISLGPYAGKNGGKMLAGKSPETIVAEIFQIYDSIKPLEAGNSVAVSVKGARANNLQHINVDFIENTLNVITGNSGSGKTSLLQYVVYDSFLASRPIECDKISGFSDFDNVVFIQQDVPAGSSMSIPATMLDLLDPIRNIFTDEAANRTLPLKAAHFSVFSKEGRCAECGGTGVVKTSMDFSSDAESVCESCNGARFNKQVLDVMVDGKSISDILNMSIFEAALFVEGKIKPAKMLVFRKMAETCHFTGIDYIPLGQNLNTLSVGELQRLKLVQGIADAKGKTLFLLDEPSGGLHPTDTQKLLELFDYLLANNHTIICASHDELIIRRSGKEIGL